MGNPDNRVYADYVVQNEAAAKRLGVQLQMLPVARAAQLDEAFVAMKREKAAAQGAVAGRAVRDRGAVFGQQGELGVAGVDVVREHAARRDQAVAAVGVQVVPGTREQPGHGRDLGQVLVDVRGEPDALAEQLRAGVQHLVRGREREPRRDRVPEPAAVMPAQDQVGAVRQRGLR